MAGIAVARKELSAAELRGAASKTKDARAVRRMLAIALGLEGMDRETASRSCGMDRQTLRDGVHRHNAEGLAGLANRRGLERPRRLTPEQMGARATWVEAGPDPVRDGVVRWRRCDLQARLAAEFGVTLHERTVGKQLAALGFRRLSGRPQHPKPDPQAQTAFKKTSPGRERRRSPHRRGPSRWKSGSRMTRGSASTALSPASGPNAAQGPGPGATRDTSGATSSVPSARRAPPLWASCCPWSTPRR